MCMQLELAGKGTVLGLQDTWRAVVGGKLGHRALLVGVLPRVCSSLIRAQHTPAKGRWLNYGWLGYLNFAEICVPYQMQVIYSN